MKQITTFFISLFILSLSHGRATILKDSVQPFEISISFSGFMTKGGEYHLSFKSNNWIARYIDYRTKKQFDFKGSDSLLKSTFNKFKNNNAFDLPNQSDLKINGIIDDGTAYYVKYIIGCRSGSYIYENPDLYLETNKNVKELKLFCNIINTFKSLFPNQ